jgi:hypothetical protein
MTGLIRLKLEMGARVRDFFRSHPLAGLGFSAAVVWFDALLARATDHSGLQQEGATTSRGATRRRAELRDYIRESILRHMVGVARVAAKERPELEALFRLPPQKAPHLVFVTSASRILVEAEANKDFLVSKGMGESAIDDLRKALTELETVDTDGHSARAKHVGARADLEAVAADIMDQVALLDGTVRYRFRDDPEILAAWKSARNVPHPSARAPVEAPATPQTPTGQQPPAVAA